MPATAAEGGFTTSIDTSGTTLSGSMTLDANLMLTANLTGVPAGALLEGVWLATGVWAPVASIADLSALDGTVAAGAASGRRLAAVASPTPIWVPGAGTSGYKCNSNTIGCASRNDGQCDDGGPNATFNDCALGEDCEDCGPRFVANVCLADAVSTCAYLNDAACDDGGPGSSFADCPLGSDCKDCGSRMSIASPKSRFSPPPPSPPPPMPPSPSNPAMTPVVTAVFSQKFASPEHAASVCIDDEQCLAITCTAAINTATTGGGHCRMVTRKTQAAGTNRIPYPNPNAKGFCMDRKIHRGVVLSPKKIKLAVNQRAAALAPMAAAKLTAWQANIAGEFERVDDVNSKGIYTWGRPVYKRTSGTNGWDIIKWDSLKMHWVLFDGYTNTFSYKENGYDEYGGHKVAMASDAAFPTSGRWSATGFTPASHNGI